MTCSLGASIVLDLYFGFSFNFSILLKVYLVYNVLYKLIILVWISYMLMVDEYDGVYDATLGMI